MPGAEIGRDCVIGQNVYVAGNVRIGNGVKIQNNVSVYDGVTCEDDVFIGPSVVFTNVINPRSFLERKEEYLLTTIKKGASLGANCTIVCGNGIGEYAMIGAGAVVTEPVPAYGLYYGNPARQHGWVSRAGHRLDFIDGEAVCRQEWTRYILANGIVTFDEG
jgi:UDP-2-acetamido-3-amino-2,3-dideoxy-glucuronate N-acetyltransferase